jgi:vacuolar-type H+-ATPase subunit E/Vma4
MGAPDTLAKRIEEAERKARQAAEKLKQLRAQKAASDARQKAIEARRAKAVEDRRKSEVGSLVKLAGLLDLDNATLLGSLMIAAEQLQTDQARSAARHRGEQEMVAKAATKPSGTA